MTNFVSNAESSTSRDGDGQRVNVSRENDRIRVHNTQHTNV